MKPEYILIALAVIVAIVIALRGWMADNARVRAEVEALTDVPLHLKADILDCLDAAAAADRQTWLYDLSAPIVMLLVLPFVKRSADKLPRAFRRWDNNVSINGDGEAVLRDGQWINLRDIGWTPEPGERVYTYDDPAYTGNAYYANAHPRSFWARYVWLGWRNRASQLSVDLGRDVAARPVCISGDTTIGTRKEGHFLLRDGDTYHFKSVERTRIIGLQWALIRSYGYKLEIVRNSQDGTGLAAAVAIGRSLKRWKA